MIVKVSFMCVCVCVQGICDHNLACQCRIVNTGVLCVQGICDHNLAYQCFRLTLASNNDHAEAYNNLGVLELKRGHVEAVSSLIVNCQYPALGASRPVLGLLYVLCLR